eukprot:GHVR01007085.1.p1 GENE.GHVR01007085.1~~GHVR01007085.1.p1  ORF type:complete len:122 (+),score=20.13 GHVR01007085.1:28-366(+)
MKIILVVVLLGVSQASMLVGGDYSLKSLMDTRNPHNTYAICDKDNGGWVHYHSDASDRDPAPATPPKGETHHYFRTTSTSVVNNCKEFLRKCNECVAAKPDSEVLELASKEG